MPPPIKWFNKHYLGDLLLISEMMHDPHVIQDFDIQKKKNVISVR